MTTSFTMVTSTVNCSKRSAARHVKCGSPHMTTTLTMVSFSINNGKRSKVGHVTCGSAYMITMFTMVSCSVNCDKVVAPMPKETCEQHNVPSPEGTQMEHIYMNRMSISLVLMAG